MVDWDNDGNKDMLVGCADGNVYLYLNQRLDASPDFASAVPTIVVSVNTNAAPCAVLDWDGDGNKDLLVGDGDGSLHLFLNEGADDAPSYPALGTQLTDLSSSVIDVGAFSRPVVADYNQDHIKDILVGTESGNVCLFDGTGALVSQPEGCISNFALFPLPRISFNSSTDRFYTLQMSSNIVGPAWFNIGTGIPGSNAVMGITDSNAVSGDSRYYRLEVGSP